MEEKKKVNTPEFRVSYPNVFKPKLNELSKKEEYSVVALFPKGTDLKKLEALAMSACTEKWGADRAKWPKPLRSPFRNQGERAKEGVLPSGYEEGGIFVNLKSQQRPGIVDKDVQDIIDQTQFYPGCYAIASVTCYAYGGPGTKFLPGVAFGLGNIQKTRDGEPFGNRTAPADDFAPIAGVEGDAKPADAGSLFG